MGCSNIWPSSTKSHQTSRKIQCTKFTLAKIQSDVKLRQMEKPILNWYEPPLCRYRCFSIRWGTWLFVVRASVRFPFAAFQKIGILMPPTHSHTHVQQTENLCLYSQWCSAINCMRLLLLVLLFVVVVVPATFANLRYCHGAVRARSFWHPFRKLIRHVCLCVHSTKTSKNFRIRFFDFHSRNVAEHIY